MENQYDEISFGCTMQTVISLVNHIRKQLVPMEYSSMKMALDTIIERHHDDGMKGIKFTELWDGKITFLIRTLLMLILSSS